MPMKLTDHEKRMLDGEEGWATQKAMEIQLQMGEIYGAEKMIPVTSVHMPGVSSTVTGEPACMFVEKMRDTGGKFKVLTTMNPCAVDICNWKQFGFSQETYDFQMRLVNAYLAMGAIPTLTCTPFFEGNAPRFGEHVAWGESSAIVYCNSIIGARTNREGGPGALAAALTGVVPAYGYHLDENRYGQVLVHIDCKLNTLQEYGAMGHAIGIHTGNRVPVVTGLDPNISVDNLRSFAAAMATGGSTALFHAVGITPEAPTLEIAFGSNKPEEEIVVSEEEMRSVMASLSIHHGEPIDLVALGCPFLSLKEIAELAERLKGKKLADGVELWLMAGHAVVQTAKRKGYVDAIEATGAKFMVDTCPDLGHLADCIKALGLRSMATNSAKLSHYIPHLWNLPTVFKSTDECLDIALNGNK
ncbi:MAG: aconitase X [Acetivibrionales bacterium]|jgi:predicted aconitase